MNALLRPRLEALAAALSPHAQLDAPLARHSMVGIGGPADLLVIAGQVEVLVQAVSLAREAGLPWRVFGGLTNLLLPDAGLRGVVLLNRCQTVRWEEDYRLYVEAGAPVIPVAREAVRRGWAGLTWAVGLPGTIGGAVVNNAGAFGGDIAGILASAEVLGPDGTMQTVGGDWFDFRYRCSRLKGAGQEWLALSATFQLRPGDPEYLLAKADEYAARRRNTQPPGKTLGSTFKNPPGDYAGRLIEAAGLKGARVGDVVVSTQHANFFINAGAGTAADFVALLKQVQERVVGTFGIRLEPEIEIVN